MTVSTIFSSFILLLSFSSKSSEHLLSQTIRARELTFCEKVHLPHLSHVMCHMSCVTFNFSECRKSAKSSFLVIAINYICNNTLKVWDKNSLLTQVHKKGKKKDYVFLGFKCNILNIMLMHCNQCINLCSEKCNLDRIPICCQCSSSITSFMES